MPPKRRAPSPPPGPPPEARARTTQLPAEPPVTAAAADMSIDRRYGSPALRLRVHVLTCGYILALKVARAAIPSLMPIVAAELGYSEAELAANLSGFFLG